MPGRLVELVLFGIAPLVLASLLAPMAAAAGEVTISGEVSYRERIALPEGAVLTVRLAEVSLAGTPGAIVAEQAIDPAGQVPIPFELKVDEAALLPQVKYALQARITVGDRLWFTNDDRNAVDLARPEPQKLMLNMVRQDAAAAPGDIFGKTWIAEDIGGGGVIDNARSTFSVAPDGKVSGRGGCNGYFAEARLDGDRIEIGKAGATMMACAEALMDQERKFFAALEKAASFRIDDRGRLFLADAGGADLVRFAADG